MSVDANLSKPCHIGLFISICHRSRYGRKVCGGDEDLRQISVISDNDKKYVFTRTSPCEQNHTAADIFTLFDHYLPLWETCFPQALAAARTHLLRTIARIPQARDLDLDTVKLNAEPNASNSKHARPCLVPRPGNIVAPKILAFVETVARPDRSGNCYR